MPIAGSAHRTPPAGRISVPSPSPAAVLPPTAPGGGIAGWARNSCHSPRPAVLGNVRAIGRGATHHHRACAAGQRTGLAWQDSDYHRHCWWMTGVNAVAGVRSPGSRRWPVAGGDAATAVDSRRIEERAPKGPSRCRSVEATIGFEPMNKGFADPRVRPLRHVAGSRPVGRLCCQVGCPSRIRTSANGSKVRCPTTRRRGSGAGSRSRVWGEWSGRRDSNPRPSPWQGDALPTEPLPLDVPTRGWCREPDSNWRHRDFQSRALPTELSRPGPGLPRGSVGAAQNTMGPVRAARRAGPSARPTGPRAAARRARRAPRPARPDRGPARGSGPAAARSAGAGG